MYIYISDDCVNCCHIHTIVYRYTHNTYNTIVYSIYFVLFFSNFKVWNRPVGNLLKWYSLWSKIQDLLQTLSTPIPLNPMHFLLGLPLPVISKASGKLMSFILLAAKRTIPRHWLSTSPPTFHHLLSIMADICGMEHLTAKIEDTLPLCYKI